ncbi:MAG TPA: hypothetical protein VHJ82_01675, partial [Actinomycetota bacterium]|nr:hypothetical protein [Actinomycetota bacterium]
RYFTERGQPARLLKDAREILEEAQAQVDKLSLEMRGVEDDIARAIRMDAELKALRDQEKEVTRAAMDAETRWQAVLVLADAVESSRSKRDLNAERLKRASNELALRRQLLAQTEDARGRVRELTEELNALESGYADLLAGHRAAEERVAAARRDQAEALEAYGLAQRCFQLRRDEFDLATLTERHGRVTEAMAALVSARSVIEQSQIDEGRLDAIRKRAVEVERTRGALEAGGALVSVRSLGPDLKLQVDGYPVAIKSDESGELRVTEALSMTLAGQLEIELRPGSTVEGLAKEHQRAVDHLGELLRDVGVADLAAAENALQQRRSAELSVEHAEETLGAGLRDLTLEQMEGKIAALRLAVDTAMGEGIDDKAPPLEEARRVARDSEQVLHAAQRSLRESEAELGVVARQSQQISERRSDLIASLRAAEEQLRIAEAQLEQARANTADDALQLAHQEAEQGFQQAESQLSKAEADLSARAPEDLRRLAEDAESARDEIGRKVQELQQRHIELMADLRARGELGLHARFAEADAVLEDARRDADRIETRAAGARLLYETMANNRQAATRAYVRPLKDAIERLGRVVFGDGFGVEIDETLQIATRVLDGNVVPFKHLSGGAKEQLSLITRIACASLVSPEDGVPVLIDDALGNSDPGRLEAMAAVLSLVGRTCQVILLTCHPGWYARIAGAKVVSLS